MNDKRKLGYLTPYARGLAPPWNVLLGMNAVEHEDGTTAQNFLFGKSLAYLVDHYEFARKLSPHIFRAFLRHAPPGNWGCEFPVAMVGGTYHVDKTAETFTVSEIAAYHDADVIALSRTGDRLRIKRLK